MKKQSLSLFMLFSLALSIPNPAHALSFMEQAEKIKQKAIALAKKGGTKSKELWDKINFMGNAEKERKAAKKILDDCQIKYCEIEEAYEKSVLTQREKWMLYKCSKRFCSNEYERFKRADHKLDNRLIALLTTLGISIPTLIVGVGLAAGPVEQEQEQTGKWKTSPFYKRPQEK